MAILKNGLGLCFCNTTNRMWRENVTEVVKLSAYLRSLSTFTHLDNAFYNLTQA